MHSYKIPLCCSELTVSEAQTKGEERKEADKCFTMSTSFPFPAFSLNFANCQLRTT